MYKNRVKHIIILILECLKKITKKIIDFFKKKNKQIYSYFKTKKYKKNKIKIFFIKIFSYIGSSITYLISKICNRNNNIKKIIEKNNNEIKNIEKRLDEETSTLVIKMYSKKIDKKIRKIENNKKINSREEIKLVKDHIEKLNIVKKEINVTLNKLYGNEKSNDISDIEKINNNSNVTKIKTKNNNPKNKLKPKIINKKKNIKRNLKISKIVTLLPIIKNRNFGINNSNTNKNLKNIVLSINKDIDNAYKRIYIIKKNNDLNKEKEYTLLKGKILKLKEEYIELRKKYDFDNLENYSEILKIDTNHILYHEKSLDDLIIYLEISINDIKNKKEIIKKEQKSNDIKIDLSQLKTIKESVKKDIALSKKEINKIKLELSKINNKKPNLLPKITYFFKNSINVCLSLIPFGIFKNKLFATLTSGIIINNKIRCMKSIINNDEIEFIEYEELLKNIVDKNTCLNNTNYVLLNTINEIDELVIKIKKTYMNSEANELLNNLEEMKEDLLAENSKIEKIINGSNKIKKLLYK